MNLTVNQTKKAKKILAEFEKYQQVLSELIKPKHQNKEITLNALFQILLDQNHQLFILKELMVKLFEMDNLDPKKDNYLDKIYSLES